jgi:hypothetical protein
MSCDIGVAGGNDDSDDGDIEYVGDRDSDMVNAFLLLYIGG